MALTTTAAASTLEQWESAYFEEYVRESGFKAYMGPGSTKPFVVKRQLTKGGQVIHIPLVSALREKGVGVGTLTGNEEALGNHNYDVKVYWHRHAVMTNKDQEHKSSIDLRKACTDMLKVWEIDDMRDRLIDALGAVAEDSSKFDENNGHSKEALYHEASTAQKNAWSAANQYRILYGDTEGNYSATHATGLTAVAAASDALTAANVSLMKVMARRRQRTATGASVDVPSVRPIRTGSQGREFYVCFTDTKNFQKLKADQTMVAANRDARPRDVASNPLFQDGDLLWDGVVIREVPEIPQTSSTVSPAYFCGAQALGFAWGQMPRGTERKEDDYGFIKGVGVESLWAVEKLRYQGIDHGLVTGFFYTG